MQYARNASGGDDCDKTGATSGPRSCLGGWYVPNAGEFEAMFHALCGTGYELPTDTKYWTSTFQQEAGLSPVAAYFAVTLPADCATGDLTYERTSSAEPANNGYAIRYIRQFG